MSRWITAAFALLFFAAALPAFAQEPPAAPGGLAADGFFVEPSFLLSGFVTDKGTLTRKAGAVGYDRDLNVHTGEWNWILAPGLGLGWDWGRWQAMARANYDAHLLKLDLPYGETASGNLTSMEVGPEIFAYVGDWGWSTVELGFGGAARFLSRATLEYQMEDGPRTSQEREFVGRDPLAGFTVHIGGAGELMTYNHVRAGWLIRLVWSHHELTSDQTRDAVCGGEICSVDEERLNMNVYSLMFGVRLRIVPWPPAR